jgi:hypothetical protein
MTLQKKGQSLLINSSTTPDFWASYSALPAAIKLRARRVYRLWKENPRHPSLRFKKIGAVWSIRIDPDYRALGLMENDILYWFWIGAHDDYERLIGLMS